MSPRVWWSGNLDEDVRDAGLVALSFLRAHTTWIGQRYQLYTNPRRRRHRDWMLGFLSVADEISGTSIGAALAGTAPLLTALRGKGLRGRFLYLCMWQ